jgi:eukaryotic-like serine/threonine-protein kinase
VSTVPHRLRVAFSSAVDLDTKEGRTFLQSRLALFGRVGMLLSFGYFSCAYLSVALTQPWHAFVEVFATRWTLLHLSTGIAFLIVWLACRSGTRPRWLLDLLDAGILLAVCAVASLPPFFGRTLAEDAYAMVLLVTTLVVMRSIFVPSAPIRTLWTGLAVIAAALPGTYLYQATTVAVRPGVLPFVVQASLWYVVAVASSTVASSIIFGLREKVREARQLGQYTLEEKLGEGGMGIVYRARHAMLRRPTAIKLLPADKAKEHGVQRFEREVQLTAQLSHPNTVAIYDYGRTPDGIFYYAMEYLEGINLEALVREFGPQPPARVAHLMRQVAGALGEAHGVGLIHRDVKPANIILCQRGGAPDVAKVVDFGLVKALEEPTASPDVSALNVIKGTPLYLSPESISAPDKVDGRSDLYALGAVGYYLLTGTHVFEAATVIEVCSHHLHTVPEPPSARLGQTLPARLEAVILSCLEKNAERRPQSAQALAAALLACDDVGPWTEREALAWWADHCEHVERACRGVKCHNTMNVDLAERLDPVPGSSTSSSAIH